MTRRQPAKRIVWSAGWAGRRAERRSCRSANDLRDSTRLKLLQGFLERMLFRTIVVLGAVVLIVLQVLGYG
jgi:hypothetical protein